MTIVFVAKLQLDRNQLFVFTNRSHILSLLYNILKQYRELLNEDRSKTAASNEGVGFPFFNRNEKNIELVGRSYLHSIGSLPASQIAISQFDHPGAINL